MSTNEESTAAEPAELSEAAARKITDKIKRSLDVTWELIAEAYRGRADQGLGYPTWDDYVGAEFGTSPLRVPREARPVMVRSLRNQGMPLRVIATAMGIDERTVRRDLDTSTAANAAVGLPDKVTGLDGRDQPATRPKATASLEVAQDLDTQAPPSSRDGAATFRDGAESLLLAARKLEPVHLSAKKIGGRKYDAGVAAVRQAVTLLAKIAASQDRAI